MIELLIALPLIVAACFGLLGAPLADRIPPRQATWLLTAGATVIAISGLAILVLLAIIALGQWSEVADEGHWSVASLQANAPIDRWAGFVALAALAVALFSVAVVAIRRGRRLLGAYRSCAMLAPDNNALLIVTDGSAGALAVPGRPGRIVVSRELLAGLSAPQRRAVLAHERSHLEHGHHWHLFAVALASAANPLLRPLRGAIERSVERWADEDAAAVVGDRRQVAAALTRAALMVRGQPRLAGQYLAVAALAVPVRVEALLGDPPRSRPTLVLLPLALLVAAVAAALIIGKDTENLFEFAGRAYRTAHGR